MSPGLTIVSGNGQVTQQFINTTVPMTVQARDAAGNPIPNLPLTWSVTQGEGTIVYPPGQTDANGMAGAYFRGDVPAGYSFAQQTITVSSSAGTVEFRCHHRSQPSFRRPLSRSASGRIVESAADNRTLTGPFGSTHSRRGQSGCFRRKRPAKRRPIPNSA